MNKTFFSFISIILFSLCIFGQKTSTIYDFSGTWELDEKASLLTKKQREKTKDYKLIINDKGNKILINVSYLLENDNYEKKIVLNADNSDEKSFDFKNGKQIREINSTTYRKKNVIYRSYIRKMPFGKKNTLNFKVTEKYKLSKKEDKITLTINGKLISTSDIRLSEVFSGSQMYTKEKYVFRKQK